MNDKYKVGFFVMVLYVVVVYQLISKNTTDKLLNRT